MWTTPATIAPEIIGCIADGREPNVGEVSVVAQRILEEVRGQTSAFGWGQDVMDSSIQLLSVRAARAAMAGAD